MFANAKVLIFVASCALVAQAQTSSGTAAPATPSLSPCIQSCLMQSASPNTCADFTNVTCVCTNQAFQAAAGACLVANCTQADQAAAAALQQQECSSVNSTTSSSSTASAAKGTTTAASVSASASATPTHSNAASAMSAPLSLGGIFGTLVASAGALVGAAFVL